MELSEVTRKNAKAVKAIYHAAFPKEERMPFWTMRLLAKMPTTQLLAFYEGGTLCGFAYVGLGEKVAFLMFLAVDQASRSQGHGSAILQALRERYPHHKHLVSIELCGEGVPNREQRLRRKAFYLRNSYQENGVANHPLQAPPGGAGGKRGFLPPRAAGLFPKLQQPHHGPALGTNHIKSKRAAAWEQQLFFILENLPHCTWRRRISLTPST